MNTCADDMYMCVMWANETEKLRESYIPGFEISEKKSSVASGKNEKKIAPV